MIVRAWHWCGENMRTRYTDRRIVVGKTLTVKGPPLLCSRGLHASKNILDALQYAPGPILCRVELSGEIVTGSDKLAATKRKVLWCMDATPILRQWIKECVARCSHLDCTDARRARIQLYPIWRVSVAAKDSASAAEDFEKERAWQRARLSTLVQRARRKS